mmetsp:Transcript_57181/g.159138  ORF Transcript_57181/g.159138 Transcript_57181/m.159138 type:complete len:209 (+) Transcript_57181:960-1586(+)
MVAEDMPMPALARVLPAWAPDVSGGVPMPACLCRRWRALHARSPRIPAAAIAHELETSTARATAAMEAPGEWPLGWLPNAGETCRIAPDSALVTARQQAQRAAKCGPMGLPARLPPRAGNSFPRQTPSAGDLARALRPRAGTKTNPFVDLSLVLPEARQDHVVPSMTSTGRKALLNAKEANWTMTTSSKTRNCHKQLLNSFLPQSGKI